MAAARLLDMRWILTPCMLLGACHVAGIPPTPLAPNLPVVASLTEGLLQSRASDASFDFLVAGHLYGDPSKSSMPSASFRTATTDLAALGADLLVCCGDTFRHGTPECFSQTVDALERLQIPVFNAVGNHDVNPRNAYSERFGNTYGAFVHGGCAFIVLDSEQPAWQIAGQQLAFLDVALQTATDRKDIRAVFCFAHKLVFAHRQQYFEVLLGSNALDGLQAPNRFTADVLPLLTQTAKHKPVYWFGGDIGVAHTMATFYDHDELSGVTFVATGIGDLVRDSVVNVTVHGKDVRLSLLPLTSQPAGKLTDFGVKAWADRISPNGLPRQLETFRSLLPN
ncbi:MAG: hypothetical protein ACI8UD_003872 [Planctomycetota bacterium]|jgi:hypothetical protein